MLVVFHAAKSRVPSPHAVCVVLNVRALVPGSGFSYSCARFWANNQGIPWNYLLNTWRGLVTS